MAVLDLRNNAFFILGATPQATQQELVEASEDMILDHPEKEGVVQLKLNEILAPITRLPSELTYLWDLHLDQWEEMMDSIDYSRLPQLTQIAQVNLAAHYCARKHVFSDEQLIHILQIQISNSVAYDTLDQVINKNRNIAKLPSLQTVHYQDAVEKIQELHRQSVMCAIEQASHGGKVMTTIVEHWRYDRTSSGQYIDKLVQDYDKWSIRMLRPIENRINQLINILYDGLDHPRELDELVDDLLPRWDEYSQPVQLMNEAKNIDDPRSKNLIDKIRQLSVHLHNTHKLSSSSLRISEALLHTFIELPGKKQEIISDINTLKEFSVREMESKKINEFMTHVEWIRNNINDFGRRIESKNRTHQSVTEFIELTKSVLKTRGEDESAWIPLFIIVEQLIDGGHEKAADWLSKQYKILCREYRAPLSVKKDIDLLQKAIELRINYKSLNKLIQSIRNNLRLFAKELEQYENTYTFDNIFSQVAQLNNSVTEVLSVNSTIEPLWRSLCGLAVELNNSDFNKAAVILISKIEEYADKYTPPAGIQQRITQLRHDLEKNRNIYEFIRCVDAICAKPTKFAGDLNLIIQKKPKSLLFNKLINLAHKVLAESSAEENIWRRLLIVADAMYRIGEIAAGQFMLGIIEGFMKHYSVPSSFKSELTQYKETISKIAIEYSAQQPSKYGWIWAIGWFIFLAVVLYNS